MSTGENIRRFRKERGLTQRDLGNLCGMADSAIRRYEANRANPKIETLQKIANALNVPITSLASYDSPLQSIVTEFISYKATTEQQYKLFFELLRLMGYVIEFHGCLEVRDMYPYDEEKKGFLIEGEISTNCTYGDGVCETCEKRKNTYYQISKNGKSIKISCYMMLAYIGKMLDESNNLMASILNSGDLLDNQEFGIDSSQIEISKQAELLDKIPEFQKEEE